MKNILIVVITLWAAQVNALPAYYSGATFENGNMLCHYTNGAVIVIRGGAGRCPIKIEG